MIPILIDTREQKTPAIVERFKAEHKIMAGDYEFISNALPVADFFGNDQLIEFKGGQDIHNSTYSPDHHLLNQIIRMSQWLEDHPGTRGHLVCADSENYNMINYKQGNTIKVVMGWSQDYGIRFHHRLSLDDGVLCLIHLIKDPPAALKRIMPLSNSKKDPFLIRVLSQIEGVSVEFAEFLLSDDWKTIDDLNYITPSYLQAKVREYYKKEMGSLVDKILEKIG